MYTNAPNSITGFTFKHLVIALTAVVCPIWAQSGNPAIATGQYDSNRSSANLDEITLNHSNVTASQFGKLFSWTVDGWVWAQPLYVPGVPIPGGPSKNVVYVATMNNSIYAFNADNPSAPPLWRANFGTAVRAPTANGCPNGVGPLLGILSTPVIDPPTNTLYAVSATPTGVSSSAPRGIGYLHYLHAIDITTGQEKPGSPVQIQANVPGNGYDAQNGTVSLSVASKVFQRTALLLANGTVYAGFGSCSSDADPWHGWVVGYATSNLTRTAVFNSTPNSGQGGIWQSGRGLASDATGDVYFNTGNATPYTSYDASFPVTAGNSTTDAQRNDYPMRFVQLNAAGQFLSSYPPANYAALNTQDLDFSSSGPLVIPGHNLLVTGGKEGIIYLFSSSNLSTPLQSFQATGTSACNLAAFDGCNQIHDLAFWNNTLYVWGGYDILRAYAFSPSTNQFNPTPVSKNTIATQREPASFAISANGNTSGTGIVWAVLPNSSLHAFDASNVASELWNSNQNSSRDALPSYPKFTEPTVANGRVYVATHSNQVAVYGLLSNFSLSTSAASLTANQNATATVTVDMTVLGTLSSPVTLSVSGLPAGATAVFTPPSLSSSGSSALKITTSASTPTGTYNLIVTGTTGSIVRTASLSFTVTTPDTTPPQWTCCTYTPSGSSYVLGYTAWDTQSGLKSIEVVQQVNAQVSIPSFQPGARSTVNFTETQSGTYSYVEFKLTDVAGNVAYIDPIYVDAARAKGKPLGYPAKNLTPDVGVLTIQNGSPGLKNVRIEITNGPDVVKVQVAGLKDGEVRVLDLTSDIQVGSAGTITPLGKPDGTALFIFGNVAMTGSPQ